VAVVCGGRVIIISNDIFKPWGENFYSLCCFFASNAVNFSKTQTTAAKWGL
jgi:hypothetical protein